MCGFAGFFDPRNSSTDMEATVRRMSDAITSRGPDSFGEWVDRHAGVALGHRRLAIVDLTPTGRQPMSSPSMRYVIAFNGEIYNHLELRREIEGVDGAAAWKGSSDTETLLAGFDAWGVEATVRRCAGMFAFAVWDKKDRCLTLARDRMGEKPLYYGWSGSGSNAVFLFGSEIKAIRQHSNFNGEVDRGALCLFMRHNCVPSPYSIYRGYFKLPPGCCLTLDLSDPLSARERAVDRKPIPFWTLEEAIIQGRRSPFEGSPEQAVDELEALLKSVIGQQMMADVPLGAFLSGGVDSSTVVALMQSQSERPVKTFTIGFEEKGYNEAVHAEAVARHLGTDHTELYVSPRQAMDVIPLLPRLYDEPFSDSSQIPTYLVSKLARRNVTVSLSGDGGDELFSGYTRYLAVSGAWNKISRVPRSVRTAAARLITSISPATLDGIGRAVPSAWAAERFGDKLHKGATLMGSRSVAELYMGAISHWGNPEKLVLGGSEPPTRLTGLAPDLRDIEPVERMMALDMLSYLPDDILVKVDRAAMGVSLESRVPFLDHRLVEFAWRLPQSVKFRDGRGKWVLREVLYRHVPRSLIDRPKMGFGIPLDSWLRGPLREWAENLLASDRLRAEGYFDPAPIREKWAEHLDGRRNWAHHLWDVLMFQSWMEDGAA